MKKIFLLATLCALFACASPPAIQERTENPSRDEVMASDAPGKAQRYNEAFYIFGQILMTMAYVREYGIPGDGDRMGDVSEMEYILNEINENKELTNLVADGLWLAQENKEDESLAAFDEIYKRYSKDKRATARDAAAISRLYKYEKMAIERKTDEAQAIMDELSREFDVNDPGIQVLLKLMKSTSQRYSK
jgi:hypothetical protein